MSDVSRAEHADSGRELRSDCGILIYHQRDDVVEARCGSLKGLPVRSGRFHCKEPVRFSAWTSIIVDLETGIGLKKIEGNPYGAHEFWNSGQLL